MSVPFFYVFGHWIKISHPLPPSHLDFVVLKVLFNNISNTYVFTKTKKNPGHRTNMYNRKKLGKFVENFVEKKIATFLESQEMSIT